MVLFESGHPDKKSSDTEASGSKKVGALGALEKVQDLEFGVENPNTKITEKMIKSIKLFTANNDINKRWYVEYQEWNPVTNEWCRRRDYKQHNREKDPQKRLALFLQLQQEITSAIYNRIKVSPGPEGELHALIQYYLAEKKRVLKRTSIKNMALALRYFLQFLKLHKLDKMPPQEINKSHIIEFRNWLSKNSSNRSVNGHISFVSTFFNYLLDNREDLILKNPCNGIRKLPEISETHVAYSNDQATKYFDYMGQKNPQLLLFCKFIGMAFIRCEEARHIKVGDIDFQRKTITVSAGNIKTGKRTVKPLLDVFYQILLNAKIHKYPPEYYVFSGEGHPGEKQVHYNYFRKQFKKIKNAFGLNSHYTIYGFRHTFVSQLIDNGAKWHEVMKYTGHTTMEAFSKYARSLGLKPAEDLSRFITIN